jgi:hypothetical protein
VETKPQSRPSLLPFIQLPPSEMGLSGCGKLVEYVLPVTSALLDLKSAVIKIVNIRKLFISGFGY